MTQSTAVRAERETLQARLEREHNKPLPEILHWALNAKKNPTKSVRGAARLLNASPGAIQYFVYRFGFRRNTSWLYAVGTGE